MGSVSYPSRFVLWFYRCVVLGGTKAEDAHLELVHTKDHVNLVKSSTNKKDYQSDRVASLVNSIYLNGSTSEAAYLAAGSVVEVNNTWCI